MVAPPRPIRAPWILFGVLVAAAVAVVILIPVVVPDVGFGVVTHEICSTGKVLETADFWTPEAMENSPYLGESWANETSGAAHLNTTNGQANGLFVLDQWDLVATQNTSVAGPGLATPCTAAATATYTATSEFVSLSLLPPGSTNDLPEQTSFIHNGTPSVIFDNTLTGGGSLPVNTCGTDHGQNETATSAVYPIVVPLPGAGGRNHIAVLYPASVSYAYRFPENGIWTASWPPRDASGGYEGGWSFSYRSCVEVPPPGSD